MNSKLIYATLPELCYDDLHSEKYSNVAWKDQKGSKYWFQADFAENFDISIKTFATKPMFAVEFYWSIAIFSV